MSLFSALTLYLIAVSLQTSSILSEAFPSCSFFQTVSFEIWCLVNNFCIFHSCIFMFLFMLYFFPLSYSQFYCLCFSFLREKFYLATSILLNFIIFQDTKLPLNIILAACQNSERSSFNYHSI